MDFNSIFGRGGSELSANITPSTTLQEWEHFLTNIYPRGRSTDTIPYAREQYSRVLIKQAKFREELEDTSLPVQKQVYMHGVRAATELLEEIDRFNRSGHVIPAKSGDFVAESDIFSDLIHVDISKAHATIMSPYLILTSVEADLDRGMTPTRESKLQREIYKIYRRFVELENDIIPRFETLKRNAKAQLPTRAKPLVDKVTDLFIKEPIEAGLLAIRRNFPGAVGAFYGIDEGEE